MPSEKRPKRSTKKSPPAAAPIATPETVLADTASTETAVVETPIVASIAAPAVAPAAPSAAVLTFGAGWQEQQQGALTAGGSLVVNYEPARLVSAVADAAPASEIVGYARFSPGGHIQQARLVGGAAKRSPRKATVVPTPVAAEIAIPAEAEEVELWFEGRDATGSTSWDSRFGANYRFEVVRP